MRKNGFEFPLNGMQISTYVLVIVLVAHFALCLTPVLPLWISIVATAVFAVTGGLSIYFGYVTTKTDSIDERLYEHIYHTPHPNALKKLREGEDVPRMTTNDSENPDSFRSDDTIGTKYCWVCQTNVYDLSMHCKYCDKCVQKFDHHCMWLNTCVGEANYPTFFKTVSFTFLFILVHAATIIIYTVYYFMDLNDMKQVSANWVKTGKAEVLLGINLAFLALTGFAAFLVCQLLVFHIGLRKKNITTYEYILQDTAKKRDAALVDDRIRQRRSQELNRSDLSLFKKYLIKSAGNGVCKPCDPIRHTIEKENDSTVPPNTQNGTNVKSPTSGESNTPERSLKSPLQSEDSDSDDSILDSSSARTGCLELTRGDKQTTDYEKVPAGANTAQENQLQ